MAKALAWRPSRAVVAMAPAVAVLALVAFLLLRAEPTSVMHLDDAALRHTSSWIESAYRSDHGRGELLIGRMRDGYLRLPDERRIEAARELADRLRGQGIRDAMLYDAKGRLVVHYASGVLRRPEEA